MKKDKLTLVVDLRSASLGLFSFLSWELLLPDRCSKFPSETELAISIGGSLSPAAAEGGLNAGTFISLPFFF